jgi:uncharacterized protein with ParB-like and HNH nuclease domain
MAGGFESKVISLGYFFQMRDQPLIIPGLQRNFEWGKKEVKLLWRDIGFHSKTENLDEMFVGTLIIYRDKTVTANMVEFPDDDKLDSERIKYWIELGVADEGANDDQSKKNLWLERGRSEVLDGQQRLTTILIGAKVLSEYCKRYTTDTDCIDLGKKLDQTLHYQTRSRLHHELIGEREDLANIIANHDRKKELETGWSSDAEKIEHWDPIRIAYITTYEYFKDICNGQGGKARTIKYAKFLLESVNIVLLDITAQHQKHLVFSAINHAGLKLKQSDLVKSKLFHEAILKENQMDYQRVEETWREMSEELHTEVGGNDVVSKFLHSWAESKGYVSEGSLKGDTKKLKKEDTFTAIRDNNLELLQDRQVIPFINDLRSSSKKYVLLFKPNSTLGSSIWHDILDLRRIYSGGGLDPVLLSILDLPTANNTEKIKQRECVDWLVLCTVYLVITNFVVRKSHFANSTVKDWVGLINAGNFPALRAHVKSYFLEHYTDAKKVTGNEKKVKKIQQIWMDKMIEKGHLDKPVEATAKFLLRHIERLENEYLSEYNTRQLNAEHIFPKKTNWTENKSSPWYIEWKEDETRWPEGDIERNRLKSYLGNFIILEEDVNKACHNITWRGPDKKIMSSPVWIMKGKRGHKKKKEYPHEDTGLTYNKLQQKEVGKVHYYKHHQWFDGGDKKSGSGLQSVEKFVKSMRGKSVWTSQSLKDRNKSLLKDAIDASKVSGFSLKKLWK